MTTDLSQWLPSDLEGTPTDQTEQQKEARQALTTVVSNTLLRCVVRTAPPEGSASEEFLVALRSESQLQFHEI